MTREAAEEGPRMVVLLKEMIRSATVVEEMSKLDSSRTTSNQTVLIVSSFLCMR
jgi:hypothetical protein